jgi:hypothetical protein
MPNIIDFYDPNVWKTAGNSGAVAGNMVAPYKTGLLHLVYYFLHTEAGRKFMHEDARPGFQYPQTLVVVTPNDARAAVKSKCEEYGVLGSVQEAIINAHMAGWAWVDNLGNLNARAPQEAIFKQNLSVISWALWEEGSGKLFPLGW